MSNAALIQSPRAYDSWSGSRAARRILRRAARTACPTRKKTYRTPRKARVALATLQRNDRRREADLGQVVRSAKGFYQCEVCDLYHLTTRE